MSLVSWIGLSIFFIPIFAWEIVKESLQSAINDLKQALSLVETFFLPETYQKHHLHNTAKPRTEVHKGLTLE